MLVSDVGKYYRNRSRRISKVVTAAMHRLSQSVGRSFVSVDCSASTTYTEFFLLIAKMVRIMCQKVSRWCGFGGTSCGNYEAMEVEGVVS